jgi:hypothetical protein
VAQSDDPKCRKTPGTTDTPPASRRVIGLSCPNRPRSQNDLHFLAPFPGSRYHRERLTGWSVVAPPIRTRYPRDNRVPARCIFDASPSVHAEQKPWAVTVCMASAPWLSIPLFSWAQRTPNSTYRSMAELVVERARRVCRTCRALQIRRFERNQKSLTSPKCGPATQTQCLEYVGASAPTSQAAQGKCTHESSVILPFAHCFMSHPALPGPGSI